MFSTAKHLKARSASSKRAATIIRDLANDSTLTIADRGVMLTCASIIDGIATRTGVEAKKKKAAEDQHERDHNAARAKIGPSVRALPCTTIAEKVVLACIRNHFYGHLVKSLSQPTQREIQWELDYYAQTALSDTISNAAHWVATGKGSADQAIEDIKGKHSEGKADQKIIALAVRFVEALKPSLQEAA